ncbi:hypothetical protein GCM10011332_08300 [Terasakiella brassicae]|uniref:Peptidase M48 domain-containing protein n=1 Tax=Terasakiella brassicae TaxID=1634917 RepID=A0A917BSE5_9PROT|nr:M48 family metalloprotease [Terasakiella brassicae]GGF57204.1 hypothetical protein GCM10011332_08300 [Terasakiella brassicae]
MEKIKQFKPLLGAGLCLVSLSACQTTGQTNPIYDKIPGKMQASVKERQNPELEENFLTKFLDGIDFKGDLAKKDYKFSKDVKALKQKEKSLGLTGNRQDFEKAVLRLHDESSLVGPGYDYLKKYINRVANKLLQHYSEAHIDPPVTFLITDKNYYTARMSTFNLLTLPTGTLLNIASEDELAAILAHEMSHSIFRHMNSEVWEKLAAKGVRSGLYTLGALISNKLGVDATATGIVTSLIDDPVSDYYTNVLAYEHKREDELEADLLAVDMLYNAGYNWNSVLTYIKKVSAQTPHNEAEETAKGWFHSYAFSHPSGKVRYQNAKYYIQKEYRREMINLPRLKIDAYQRHVFQGVGFKAIERRLYFNQARLAFEKKDLKTAEQKIRLSLRGKVNDPDSTIRLLFYKIRKAQGKNNKAIKNLEIAANGPEPTYEVFDILLREYENIKMWDKAIVAHKLAKRKFPISETSYMATLIKYQVMARKDKDALYTLQACENNRQNTKENKRMFHTCQFSFNDAMAEREGRKNMTASET